MAFDLKRFFEDIFKPARDEVVTIMFDVPHGQIGDNNAWLERRTMAQDWHQKLDKLAGHWGIKVNPITTYLATGGNNSDLPPTCWLGDREIPIADLVADSSIIISMPEYSATAPLYHLAKKSDKLRVASMPGVARFMEESGLSADYQAIAKKCQVVAAIFDRASGADVLFSTGHSCYFDLTAKNKAEVDDGILHPERAGTDMSLSNLPAGEVLRVPNESEASTTEGELPEKIGTEVVVYVVKKNKIVDVKGNSQQAAELRKRFKKDPGWRNIGEFALGLNDKARVTGVVLEDEKAGFHWAYGRSDHLGGTVGVKDFISPQNAVHTDIVYAKGSPIVCSQLDLIFPDNSRQTLLRDGELQVDFPA